MIVRIILSLLVAVGVGLLCLFLGVILATLNVPITDAVSSFLTRWGWVLGVLAGLWFFFTGRTTLTL
jgi:hypothetical protein